MSSSELPMLDHIGYLVKQLQHAMRSQMDRGLRTIDLSMAQYALLTAIDEAPGSSGAEIARRCFITPQSVTGLIAGLSKAKLIKRKASATHGRIIEVALSAAGRERLEKARSIVIDVEEKMLQTVDEAQRKNLAELLRSCIAGIEQS